MGGRVGLTQCLIFEQRDTRRSINRSKVEYEMSLSDLSQKGKTGPETMQPLDRITARTSVSLTVRNGFRQSSL